MAWAEEWLEIAEVPGLRVITAVLTAFVAAIAVQSLRLVIRTQS